MNLRIEGTQKEIDDFIVYSLMNNQRKIQTKSKFYPNRVGSSELLNGLIDTRNPVGRVYVEIG